MPLNRRHLLLSTAATLAPPAFAQDGWPSTPLRIVVPYPARRLLGHHRALDPERDLPARAERQVQAAGGVQWGAEAVTMTPSEQDQFFANERRRWAQVVAAGNIRAE